MPPSEGPPDVPILSLPRTSSFRKSSLSRSNSSAHGPRTSCRVHYSTDNFVSLPTDSSSETEDEKASPTFISKLPDALLSALPSSPPSTALIVDNDAPCGSRPESSETAGRSWQSSQSDSVLQSSRQSWGDGKPSTAERLRRITQESSRQGTPNSVTQDIEKGERPSGALDLVEERRNSQYFASVAKVAFDSEEHNITKSGVGPSVDFFRLLAPSPDARWRAHPDAATGRGEDPNVGRLQLLIPPTVVYSAYEVMGFFTSEDGYVVRKDDLHRSDIFQMLLPSHTEGLTSRVINNPVAVQKTRRGRWRTEAHLVLSSELNSYLDSSKLSANCALQQFVKCAETKVSVVRCAWRCCGLRPSQVFIIGSRRCKGTRPPNDLPTRAQSAGLDADAIVKILRHAVNVQGYLNTIELPRACTIQPVSGRGWAEPLELTARIAHHVERGRKLRGRFQELVADFIHGEDGRWWFLQVKALKIAPFEAAISKPLRAQTERRARTQECRGDYCRTLGMDDSIDAMSQDSRGVERRRPKGFDSLSRDEKRKYYLDQLDATKRDRSPANKPGTRERLAPRDVSQALRMILNKSIILDRMEIQAGGGDARPQDGEKEEQPRSGASTSRSTRTRRFSDFLRELEARREQAKAERQALYTTTPEDDEMEPDPLPKPHRTVPILLHDKLPAFYYELVPVCSDCFRVYLSKDHQRALKEDAARNGSPLKGKRQTSA